MLESFFYNCQNCFLSFFSLQFRLIFFDIHNSFRGIAAQKRKFGLSCCTHGTFCLKKITNYKKTHWYQHFSASSQPVVDHSVLFSIWFGSAQFRSAFSGKTKPNIYRIKSKIKEFWEVFYRIFFKWQEKFFHKVKKEYGPFKFLPNNMR